jgi:hypothetical protein
LLGGQLIAVVGIGGRRLNVIEFVVIAQGDPARIRCASAKLDHEDGLTAANSGCLSPASYHDP